MQKCEELRLINKALVSELNELKVDNSLLRLRIAHLQSALLEANKNIELTQAERLRINDLEILVEELKKVNKLQARRIRKLKRTPNEVWNISPTKKDCEMVLRQFKIYLDCEDYENY